AFGNLRLLAGYGAKPIGPGGISQQVLSGEDNWKDLLDPLDIDLRQYIINYGEMAQATYNNFISDKLSKYAGSTRYAKKNLFAKLGLNPLKYRVTKYLYATSSTQVPDAFILKSLSREAWSKESNWMGYVAISTDEGKAKLGRRDIVIVWRGTIQPLEWANDLQISLVPPSKILGEEDDDPKVHQGFYSIYTSNDPRSALANTSARDQVLEEVKRLVEEYKDEEISITIVGHSLGAAIATLNAIDIVANGLNISRNQQNKAYLGWVLVSQQAWVLALVACVGLGSSGELGVQQFGSRVPLIGYKNVGDKLAINTTKSEYLKSPGNFQSWHNLEAYLHGVAGTQGSKGGFKLEVKRDIALVNKSLDALKDEYLVPASWRVEKNKGMVQQADGSWKLMDHEPDNQEDEFLSSWKLVDHERNNQNDDFLIFNVAEKLIKT
ncbi:hypothetical protein HYC85_018588, partial [Camellia sinensis]